MRRSPQMRAIAAQRKLQFKLTPTALWIVQGFLDRGKFVILCTNAILLTKKIEQYKPHPNFTWSIHLDGDKAMHDKSVCQGGVYEKAISAIKAAKAKGEPAAEAQAKAPKKEKTAEGEDKKGETSPQVVAAGKDVRVLDAKTGKNVLWKTLLHGGAKNNPDFTSPSLQLVAA